MKLQTLFEEKKVVFSLEIFPPKKSSSIQTIYDTLDALRDIEPDFISVTYGAGGNPADRSTVQIASDIKHRYHIEPLAHLSCVNSTKEHIGRVLDDLRENDIENILALRGDLNPNVPPQTDYRYASDLIDDIKQYGGFDIAAACYPEVHPEAADLEEDLLHLKKKVDADKDFYKLIVTGYNGETETGQVEFYLCTRKGDPNHPAWSLVINDWYKVDLSSLGEVSKVVFHVASSDIEAGTGRMRTPPYFCLDGIRIKE